MLDAKASLLNTTKSALLRGCDMGCAEDIMPTLPSNSYDLIFTSPPFFNVERYSRQPSQSYIRYPSYAMWLEKFLFVVLRESARVMKEDGHIVINLKDYDRMPIASDCVAFCNQELGLKLIRTFKMRLANSEYHRNKEKNSLMYHTEPVFVFSHR